MPNPNPGTRYDIVGGAKVTKLSAGIDASAGSFSIQDETGWPLGTNGPFWVVIDAFTPAEEKVLCASRTGPNVTVAVSGRGVDGTSATSHASGGGDVYPCTAKGIIDPLNEHVASISAVHGVVGNVVGTTDTQTISNKTINTSILNSPTINGTVGGTPAFGAISVSDFTNMGHDHSDADDGGAVAFGSPGSSAVGDTVAAGTGTVPARNDHRHGREAFGTPGNSGVGDSATQGVATTVARSDHRHGREGFGSVTSETSYGLSPNSGISTSVARADHTHGTPASLITIPAVVASRTTDAAFGTTPGDDVVTAPAITGDGTTQVRIAISWWSISGTGGDVCEMQIKEGSTVLQRARLTLNSATADDGGEVSVVLVPTAASHTYKFTAMRVSGVAGTEVQAATDAPAVITVEQFQGNLASVASERPPFIVVASADAPQAFKDGADYVCDGTNDEVQSQAAVDDCAPLQSRNSTSPVNAKQLGTAFHSGGRFNISAPVQMRTAVQLKGVGQLTEFRAVSLTSTAGYPTGAGTAAIIKQAAVTDHLMTVSDLWLNLNFASGGSGHGILWSGPGGSAGDYPGTGSDPTIFIRDVFIDGGSNAARHAIWLTNNLRAGHYENIVVRDMEGNGFWADQSPDSVLADSDFGGCGTGVRIEGANWRLNSVKTFFSGLSGGAGEGFVIGSGRHTITGLESQDDQIGIILSGIKNNLSAITVDCAGTTGFEISGSRNYVSSFAIYQRSGGRFATTTTGLNIVGSRTDLGLIGWIEQTNGGTITTPVAGTLTGTRNFVRISDDSFGLRSVG